MCIQHHRSDAGRVCRGIDQTSLKCEQRIGRKNEVGIADHDPPRLGVQRPNTGIDRCAISTIAIEYESLDVQVRMADKLIDQPDGVGAALVLNDEKTECRSGVRLVSR